MGFVRANTSESDGTCLSNSTYQMPSTTFKANLFSWLRAEVRPLTEDHERLVAVLGMVRIETFVPVASELPGRPPEDRPALARAFVAKAMFDLPTTSMLIERLAVDATLRRLCGWERAGAVPSEAREAQVTRRNHGIAGRPAQLYGSEQ